MLPDFIRKFDTTNKLFTLLPLTMVGVVIFDQWAQWSTKEDYTFGYLVPFFAAYVIYERLPQIEAFFASDPERADEKPAPIALEGLFTLGAFFSLLCYALGGVMRISGPNIIGTFLNTFGFCGVAAACVWFISTKDSDGRTRNASARFSFLRLFTFPILVWIVSGPFLYLVDSQVKLILLEKVTHMVVFLLNAFNYSVSATGNIIVLPGGDHVGVADACSGIRSLTACVFMGSFLSAIFVRGSIRKLVMLGLAAGFAIVLNILRTAFLTLWAFKHGSQSIDMDFSGNSPKSPEFALGTVHDIAGYVAMGITFLVLAALVPVINMRLNIKSPEAPPPGDEPSDKEKAV